MAAQALPMAGSVAGLALLLAALAAAQEPALKQAGVCSRCHVAQVLEWSASKHVKAGTSCMQCHGPSAGHVANERNQVKPDRLPQGEAIAGLCAQCHAQGCPKTKQTAACQSCHHTHALSNPNEKQMQQVESPEEQAFAAYRKAMDAGEAAVRRQQWNAARDLFTSALKLRPSDKRAAARIKMCDRRRNPAIPGFEIVGSEFDAESGLPLHVRVASLGFEMRLVPAGEFDMGSDAVPSSKPVHTERVAAFYLATMEVTQKLWTELGLDNASLHRGDSLPVHNVSWDDAQQAIAKLNARVPGGGFRLPLEAEWEYAARAPSKPDSAWYRDNTADATKAGFRESNAYAPRPVAAKSANAWGFFDLQGNVAEWCASLLRQGEPLRVIRGGSYGDSKDALDPSMRHGERPSRRLPWNGLRIARAAP